MKGVCEGMRQQERLSERVEAFVRRLEREDVNMHGFLLTVRGQEKAKAYYAPFREGEAHRLYSVSKTFSGIAVGMLIDEGKLSLDDRIVSYFPKYLPACPDPRLARLTIRDMLRMATCFRWTTYREGVDENWAKTYFTAASTHEPGTVFHYDTSCSQVLAALVAEITGLQVIDFLEERLFRPLGLRDERCWLRDPSGCCQGGTGLCMSLRDLHRVGLCVLNGGEGLIPAWYAAEMGKKQIETVLSGNEEERYGYGWQCWRTRAGFAMYGLGGQLCVICPEKQTVLSTIADTRLDPCGVQRIYNAFFDEIEPYLDKEDMEPVVMSLSCSALKDSAAPAMESTGEYVFPEDNPLRLKRLQLKKDALAYENNRGCVSLPLSRGKVMTCDFPGWPGTKAMVSCGWVQKDLLRIRCHQIDFSPCGFDMLLQFTDDGVTVQSRKSFDPMTEGYDGVASGCLQGV